VGLFVGTIGMFTMLFLLFFRFVPVIAMSEVKGASPAAHAGGAKGGHH
jgi:molybdopterin-containing oxidoreductase family membrane subunit